MTRSIVLGSLIGIAIGMLITFSIAHGVFELSAAAQPHVRSGDDERLLRTPSNDLVDPLSKGETSHRPLRPGSSVRGPYAPDASRS